MAVISTKMESKNDVMGKELRGKEIPLTLLLKVASSTIKIIQSKVKKHKKTNSTLWDKDTMSFYCEFQAQNQELLEVSNIVGLLQMHCGLAV